MPAELIDPEAPNSLDYRATYDDAWFLERIRYWQLRLCLDHWKIKVKVRTPGPGFRDEAETRWSTHHWAAVVTFRSDQLVSEAEYTVVHELLHLKCATWENAEDQALVKVPGPLRKRLSGGIKDERELAIESIAHILVEMNGGEK